MGITYKIYTNQYKKRGESGSVNPDPSKSRRFGSGEIWIPETLNCATRGVEAAEKREIS
jgi:hypothetical protein